MGEEIDAWFRRQAMLLLRVALSRWRNIKGGNLRFSRKQHVRG